MKSLPTIIAESVNSFHGPQPIEDSQYNYFLSSLLYKLIQPMLQDEKANYTEYDEDIHQTSRHYHYWDNGVMIVETDTDVIVWTEVFINGVCILRFDD